MTGTLSARRDAVPRTKKEMASAIAIATAQPVLLVGDIVQRTLDAIASAIVEYGRCELRNFGVFEVRFRARRQARNPRTGEVVECPAHNVLRFEGGLAMLARLDEMPPARRRYGRSARSKMLATRARREERSAPPPPADRAPGGEE